MDGKFNVLRSMDELQDSIQLVAKTLSLDYRQENTQDPYGALRSATLTLESLAIDIKISSANELRYGAFKTGSVLGNHIIFDDPYEPRDKLVILMIEVSSGSDHVPPDYN